MNLAGTSLKPRILLVPLDWGLGHATRCIPLIHALLSEGCEVFLGAEGPIKTLLQLEFPEISFVAFEGYEVRYSESKWSLPLVLGAQIPKILAAIKYENELLAELVNQLGINAVISDNRYGLYHPEITSIIMTHQLRIRTGMGSIADDLLQDLHYSYIRRFNECWVPDLREEPNLSGQLSHPDKLPDIPVNYIGPLSRFSSHEGVEEKHLLILLSGPEPQRTLFENMMTVQLEKYTGPVVFVRGLPGETEQLRLPGNVTAYNHLPSGALGDMIRQASLVIARSGYSTVMDLVRLKKKSILIPTPAQTEQEYLGQHLMESNFALSILQDHFRLMPALELASNFPYQFRDFSDENLLIKTVKEMINGINVNHK
ncbi:MAG: glycosyltransferase [Flavisolibacter sp.]